MERCDVLFEDGWPPVINSLHILPGTQNRTIAVSKPMLRTFRGYLIIICVGLCMAAGVAVKYRHDMDSARRSYINEEHYKSVEVAKEIEVVFRTVYQGLRIITKLPGVREIDRYGRNFSQVERQTAHEVYQSIAEIISLSEIYIVPQDFDPYQIDRVTGKPQEPIVMFDDLIHGRALGQDRGDSSDSSHAAQIIPEVEIYEYEALVGQIKLFKEKFPVEGSIKDSVYPVAVASNEIITCDNSRFDPSRPDDKSRAGFVYSLPFYDQQGLLKGVVSGTMLSSVLKEHLPNANYVLGNGAFDYHISRKDQDKKDPSEAWYKQGERDAGLVYSEVISLDIPDVFGGWFLWVGSPNENFERNNDVVVARHFRVLGFAACLILTIGACLGYYIVKSHNQHLSRMNRKLLEQQEMLEKSRSRIKKFSGKILSIREQEMKRLGRDLHDMIGSMAISLNARISVAEANIKNRQPEKVSNDLKELKKVLESIVHSFKKIVVSLRPPQLETVGLSGALREYCFDIASLAGLELEFHVDIPDGKIPEDLAIALYRVVQEALTNIVKHAKAKRCAVHMVILSKALHLSISDDGIGLESNDIEFYGQRSKMGLLGIRERVESFGGELAIESRKGGGTEYRVVIPLNSV